MGKKNKRSLKEQKMITEKPIKESLQKPLDSWLYEASKGISK